MKRLIVLALIVFSVSSFAAPQLFFGLEDIPMLRERIENPDYAYIWEENFKLANKYIDPDSEIYVDPQAFVEHWHESGWYDRIVHSRVEVLGFTTLITGDIRYAEKAIEILEFAAKKQFEPAESFQNVPHRSYAMGLDWCGDYMSQEQKQLISEAAAEFVREHSLHAFSEQTWWYPNHNWIGVDIGAAGLIALTLREQYPEEAEQWIRRCTEAVQAWFRNSYDRGGAYVEGSGYWIFGFSNALRFAIALKNTLGIDILTDSAIENLPNYLAMSLLPGEYVFDARNSAQYRGVDFIESSMFIEGFDCPLMAWLREKTVEDKYSPDFRYPERTRGYAPQRLLWQSQSVEPKSPEQMNLAKNQLFEQRGLVIWRTGWEKDDIMFSIEAGPFFPVTHNESDEGHFTLYGLGYRWAPDTAIRRPKTEGHNCILISGKGQMPAGSGVGNEGEIIRWFDDAAYGYALADTTDAYNISIASEAHETSVWWQTIGTGTRQTQERDFAKYVYRHSLFIKPQGDRPAYAVIFDDVEAVETPTEYTWQMITWPNIQFNIEEDKVTLTPVEKTPQSPRLELYVNTAARKTTTTDIYEPGDHRRPSEYPRLQVEASNTDNPRFASVLLPLKSDVDSPNVEFYRKADGSVRVSIEWSSGHKEVITCPFEDRFEPIVSITLPESEPAETLQAVRPGRIGEKPFWNGFSFTFTYVPAFEFDFIEGAAEYLFAATSHTGQVHRFTADRPDALLKPIWEELEVGNVDLKVVGIDESGNVLGISGERSFHKGAPYAGRYRDKGYNYGESAREALRKVFELDFIRYWLDNDHPDPSYYDPVVGYQYAAKIISAVIEGAVSYATLEPQPENADEVLEIGIKAADYLLSRHFPEDYALAHFPPTYDKMETRAHMDVNNAMPFYGTEAGLAYLRLFEITNEQKYFEAAEKIAEGFKQLQLDNGTWHLMVNVKTGEPVFDNYLNPQAIIEYLEFFIENFDRADFQSTVDKALEWTFANPMKNFNWQNQFEDSVPTDAYKNLSHGQASRFAQYLFENYSDNSEMIESAKELLRYVEDQFIVWSDPPKLPARTESYWPAELYSADIWLFPCVNEQYLFWQPVNRSSAVVISAFKQAYIATGEEIYLSKAKDLADTIVYAQQNYHDGNYNTYLITAERDFWVNCATGTAKTMIDFQKFLNANK